MQVTFLTRQGLPLCVAVAQPPQLHCKPPPPDYPLSPASYTALPTTHRSVDVLQHSHNRQARRSSIANTLPNDLCHNTCPPTTHRSAGGQHAPALAPPEPCSHAPQPCAHPSPQPAVRRIAECWGAVAGRNVGAAAKAGAREHWAPLRNLSQRCQLLLLLMMMMLLLLRHLPRLAGPPGRLELPSVLPGLPPAAVGAPRLGRWRPTEAGLRPRC